jgi:hypothetical protein
MLGRLIARRDLFFLVYLAFYPSPEALCAAYYVISNTDIYIYKC